MLGDRFSRVRVVRPLVKMVRKRAQRTTDYGAGNALLSDGRRLHAALMVALPLRLTAPPTTPNAAAKQLSEARAKAGVCQFRYLTGRRGQRTTVAKQETTGHASDNNDHQHRRLGSSRS